MLVAVVLCVGTVVRELDPNVLEDVGVIGVTGLVGWLEAGSGLSSFVRFFLRNPNDPNVGI